MRQFWFKSDKPASALNLALAWTLVIASLVFIVRATYSDAMRSYHDYANIYAGSKCVIDGCLPYSVPVVDGILVREGLITKPGQWAYVLPVYPPPTLVLAVPLSFVRWRVARFVTYSLTLVCLAGSLIYLYLRSTLMAAVSPALRGFLFAVTLNSPKMTFTIVPGNPAPFCFALIAFCCFDTSPKRRTLRVLLFSVACLLKPHLSLPMLLILAIKPQDGWPAVRKIAVLLVCFTGISLIWFQRLYGTATWVAAEVTNINLARTVSLSPIARTTVQRTLLNLEYLVGFWVTCDIPRTLITDAVLLILGFATVFSLWRVRQRASSPKILALAIACVATLTLLIANHAFYDGIWILLAIPWTVIELHRRRNLISATITAVLICLTYATWIRHLPESIRGVENTPAPLTLMAFLTHRSESIEVLLLWLVLVIVLFREGLPARQATDSEAIAANIPRLTIKNGTVAFSRHF